MSEAPARAKAQPPAPFDGLEGYWVDREDHPGKKSFGRYECAKDTCNNRWSSAHAQKCFAQGCQKCETETKPSLMWYNLTYPDKKKKNPDDERAAHDRARCEACRLGVCTVDEDPVERLQRSFKRTTLIEDDCVLFGGV